MSASTALLRIDDEKLEVFVRRPSWQLVISFAADEHPLFGNWLSAQTALRRWRIVVDGGDESHQLETLPRLRGRDRRALIRRRLQHWLDEPIYGRADSLGSDRQRKREHFLFSGLHRPAQIAALIDTLQQAGRRIDGMVAASALLAHFLPPMEGLIVSFSPAGMRLTVCADGRVRLSRLFPAANGEALNNSWQAELDRTLDYAKSLFSATPLTLYIVAAPHADGCGLVLPAASSTLSVALTDPARLATPLPGSERNDSTAALLGWLERAPSRLNWVLNGAARPARQLHTGLALITGALLCAGLGLGVADNRQQLHQLSQQLQATSTLADKQQLANAQLAATLPDHGFSATQMNAIAADIAATTSQGIDPLQVFRPLSAALEQLPMLILDELDWSALASAAPQPLRAQLTLTLRFAGNSTSAAALTELLARLRENAIQPLATAALEAGLIRLELELPLGPDPERGEDQ